MSSRLGSLVDHSSVSIIKRNGSLGGGLVRLQQCIYGVVLLPFHVTILLRDGRGSHVLPNEFEPLLEKMLVLFTPPDAGLFRIEIGVVPRL